MPRTFLLTKNLQIKSSCGFTLIEVLLVLGIMATLVVLAASRIQRKQTNIRSTVREFTVLGKEIRNHARLFQQTLRLVIDLDPNNPRYYIEASKSPGSNYVNKEALEKLAKGELKEDDPLRKELDKFSLHTKILRKPKSLPSGFKFLQVESKTYAEPIKAGKAFIHFFPSGYLEASAIQITDGKNLTWTILFHPLTGQVDILEEARDLRDIKR